MNVVGKPTCAGTEDEDSAEIGMVVEYRLDLLQ